MTLTNCVGNAALHMAAANGHMEPVKILLEKGAVGIFVSRDGVTIDKLIQCIHAVCRRL